MNQDVNEIVIQILHEQSERLKAEHALELEKAKKEEYQRGKKEQNIQCEKFVKKVIKRVRLQSAKNEEHKKTVRELESARKKITELETFLEEQRKLVIDLANQNEELSGLLQEKPTEEEEEEEDDDDDDLFSSDLIQSVDSPSPSVPKEIENTQYLPDISFPDDDEEEGEEDFVIPQNLTDSHFFENPAHSFKFPSPLSSSTKNPFSDQKMYELSTGEKIVIAKHNFRKKEKFYKTVDTLYSSRIPFHKKPTTIKKLVKSLFENSRGECKISTEECKVRAIYTWIVKNIRYKKEVNQPYEAEEVYKSGSTICGGFSNLFHSMCHFAGIGCRIVSGLTRDCRDDPGKVFSTPTNHAWNIVRIDGRWMNIDSSHASCMSVRDDDKTRFGGKVDEFYFLTDPKEFIFDHYSEDFQFLDTPITKSRWERMVIVNYRVAKITNLSQKRAIVVLNKGNNWKLTFRTKKGVFVKPKVCHELPTVYKEIRCCHYCQIVQGEVSLYFSFPQGKASFLVEIGIGKKPNRKNSDVFNYKTVMKYRVILVKDVMRKFFYPTKTSPIALFNDCCILPKIKSSGGGEQDEFGGRELILGRANSIRLRLPFCKGAFMNIYRKSKRYTKENNLYDKEQEKFVKIGDSGVFEIVEKYLDFKVENVKIYGNWKKGMNNYSMLYEYDQFRKK